ncbi:hypothetical protein C8J57DRAFT_1636279 [Mycena rebaudengoi]|nr:hypothetical protein C8J57DRAFT_1636279 [Mycena rebaudengoi]
MSWLVIALPPHTARAELTSRRAPGCFEILRAGDDVSLRPSSQLRGFILRISARRFGREKRGFEREEAAMWTQGGWCEWSAVEEMCACAWGGIAGDDAAELLFRRETRARKRSGERRLPVYRVTRLVLVLVLAFTWSYLSAESAAATPSRARGEPMRVCGLFGGRRDFIPCGERTLKRRFAGVWRGSRSGGDNCNILDEYGEIWEEMMAGRTRTSLGVPVNVCTPGFGWICCKLRRAGSRGNTAYSEMLLAGER